VGKGTTRAVYAEQAAAMIKVSRFRTPSVEVFAKRLGSELGWGSLSRQAIYDWEGGRTRVPAVAIFAAARVVNIPVSELFALADRFRCPAKQGATEPSADHHHPEIA